jgi:predicted nucleotidyltransferase
VKYGLTPATIQKIQRVFARFPQVEKAVLYGSRAKGNFKTGSDIDLSLTGGEDLTLQVVFKIERELDDLLLPYSFDLSIFEQLTNPDFIEHIQRVGITFYERK